MINGVIESYESKNLSQLLPQSEFDKLWSIGKTRGVGVHTYINDDLRVVARSIVKPTSDDAGRKGTVNHTVIVKLPSTEELLERIDNALQEQPELANPLPTPEV
jgi:hypothetical protein